MSTFLREFSIIIRQMDRRHIKALPKKCGIFAGIIYSGRCEFRKKVGGCYAWKLDRWGKEARA
jgi:hypothetical protein